MSDGRVDRTELERIYVDVIDCLSRAGVHGSLTYDLAMSSQLSSDLYIDGTQDEAPAVASKLANCTVGVDAAASLYQSTLPDMEVTRANSLAECVVAAYPALAGRLPRDVPYGDLEKSLMTSPEFQAAMGGDLTGMVRCVDEAKGHRFVIPGT